MRFLRTIRCWLLHRQFIELVGFEYFNQYCCKKCDSWLNRVAISTEEEMGYHAALESIERGERPHDIVKTGGAGMEWIDDFDRGWIKACKKEIEKERSNAK